MPHKNKEDLYAYQSKMRAEKRRLLCEYLAEHPCVDCGEADVRCLEFDHLPEFEKKFEVSRMVSSGTWSWKSIMSEIQKCEVRCANCHKKKTHERAGWTWHLAPIA